MLTVADNKSPPRRHLFKWWQIFSFLILGIFFKSIYQLFAQIPSFKSVFDTAFGLAFGSLLLVPLAALYLMPWLVGRRRDISTRGPLLFANVVFGWTVFGWLACLIWAAIGATKQQDEFYRKQARSK